MNENDFIIVLERSFKTTLSSERNKEIRKYLRVSYIKQLISFTDFI